jgi:hypothetical protein
VSIRNNHWYNLNSLRNYPLDDTASCLSNSGERLPPALIEDLRIRWPGSYGKYAFLSAASVTPGLVTVLIEVSHTLDNNPNSSTLIAGITLPLRELVTGRTYALQTFEKGVGGFICFGAGAEGPAYKGLFSSPQQSLITPRAARYSRPAPIPGFRLLNSDNLVKDIVSLTAETPLTISKETRVIAGVEYDNVIVFRLEELPDALDADYLASVFNEFSGPCSPRVDSRSCGDPQPLETVNGITPDCDGVLTINFEGCATVGRNVEDCGVVVDCQYGLADTCEAAYLPALSDGRLPSEVPPVIVPPPVPPEPPVEPPVSISESAQTVLNLPYCDLFDSSSGVPDGFSLIGSSSFGYIGDESPSESFCCLGTDPSNFDCFGESVSLSQSCSDSIARTGCRTEWEYIPPPALVSSYGVITEKGFSQRNTAIFVNDVQSLYRQYTVDLKIVQSTVGAKRNGGVLINYRINPDTGLPNYYVAFLDVDAKVFGIYFFNGISLVQLSSTVIGDVRAGDWYRISFKSVPNETNWVQVIFTAVLAGITDPTISATLETNVSTSNWVEDAGNAGLYVDRSNTYYSFWRIDEVV